MNKIKKIIVTLGVFTMMIGSGFAMDTNPPAEPVKAIVETEVVADAPMQTPYTGPVCYEDVLGNKVILPNPPSMNCTTVTDGPRCTITIGINTFELFVAAQNPITDEWTCEDPLHEILLFK